ncbi:MAG: UDP-N-acetylmuramoyl-L-alanyl-D-glutamate--2,6-diaminopimelate ligase [Patescibacteria group bacterium]
MKNLSELISGLEVLKQTNDTSTKIASIHFDSRFVKKNSVFVAVRGNVSDGHNFIESAVKSGAIAIIYDKESIEKISGIVYVQVKESHIALALLAQNFYGHPSKKLKLIGVTGTNGKTTTATMLFNLFEALGHPSALLSTIENRIGKKTYPATTTTPDQIVLTSFLNEAVKAGCQYAFMECTSHALDQKRVGGLEFAGALFTNLTHDHLNYHKTMENYAKAKKELFDNLSEKAFAVANEDDLWSEYILSETRARKYLFSLKDKNLKQSADGLSMSFDGKVIKSKLIGTFNAHNVLGVYTVAKLLGAPEDKAISLLASLESPAGRMEFIKSEKGVSGIIDFAHTPDALENVLKTLREIVPTARIITVVGCNGEGDVTKRPIMGEIACELSDYVVFSSDNPKNEDPEKIMKDITQNLPPQTGRYECEIDRVKAIKIAYEHAKPGDIILLAGKGHEDYQFLKDGRIPFSEKKILEKLFDKD